MRYFLISLISLSSCGPLTPKVDVNATVSGSVNTSGTITVQYNLASLTEFFQVLCQNELGVNATTAEVDQCASNELGSFLAAFGVQGP